MNQSTSASRGGLIFSAALLVAGFAVGIPATIFHPSGIDPNNHPLVFVQYARSSGWTADHLLWFVSTALTIAGVLVLIDALNLTGGAARIVARLGIVFGSAAIAMTALRDLVDGVVLKRAVDAWVGAPAAEQSARYAGAEVARWMEEASASYQGFLLGLTLLILAGLIVATARTSRPIGVLFGITGIAYGVVGWILGESGFAPDGAYPAYVTEFVPLICAAGLLVEAWRMPRAASPARSSVRSTGAVEVQA